MPIGAWGRVRLARFYTEDESTASEDETPAEIMNPEDAKKSPKKIRKTSSQIQSGHPQLCAIKVLSKKMILDSKQLDHVFNEIALQSELNHPFLVSFLKLIPTDKIPCFPARCKIHLHYDGTCRRWRTF
jgi:serine/threonine protein kinase